jgi:hypothetical protein
VARKENRVTLIKNLINARVVETLERPTIKDKRNWCKKTKSDSGWQIKKNCVTPSS